MTTRGRSLERTTVFEQEGSKLRKRTPFKLLKDVSLSLNKVGAGLKDEFYNKGTKSYSYTLNNFNGDIEELVKIKKQFGEAVNFCFFDDKLVLVVSETKTDSKTKKIKINPLLVAIAMLWFYVGGFVFVNFEKYKELLSFLEK